MSWKDRTVIFFSTGFYSGLSPVMPGTVGTVVSIPLVYLIWQGPLWLRVAATILLTLAGIYLSGRSAEILGDKDPSRVVIDEFAGYFVAMLPFEATIPNLLWAFLLFRIFDMTKPPPLRQLERMGAGWGIMMDDVGAGVLALLVQLAMVRFYPGLFLF